MATNSFNRRKKKIHFKQNQYVNGYNGFTWNSIFSNDCRHFFPFFRFIAFYCHIVFVCLQTQMYREKVWIRTVIFCNLWLRINQPLAIFLCQTFCQQHIDVFLVENGNHCFESGYAFGKSICRTNAISSEVWPWSISIFTIVR